ncbi:MAG: choice-of-anchor Q domain-containing protein [Candidatus Binatia bacterium]
MRSGQQWRVAIAGAALMGLVVACGDDDDNRTANIIVTTLADTSGPGPCTLRDAINLANGDPVSGSRCNNAVPGADAIVFEQGLTGTIALTDTLPAITGEVTIAGPASGGPITVSGEHEVGVLEVASGAMLVVENLTIANGDTASSEGAGIMNAGDLRVESCSFSGNRTSGAGGAIGNIGDEVQVENCVFTNNGAGSVGGAITSRSGVVFVMNSTFSMNVSGDGGGGAIHIAGGGSLTVNSSTFAANNSRGTGGAVETNGSATITNSTFSGNIAMGSGGALSARNGANVQINASTFAGNSATQFPGGALFVHSGGNISIKSSILARATDVFTPNCATSPSGPIVNATYNISTDASCGFGTSTGAGGQTIGDNVNPMLDPEGLQDNGGPTETIALLAGSPAIGAIPDGACTDQHGNDILFDQRGEPRPDEAPCSIGAYEFNTD